MAEAPTAAPGQQLDSREVPHSPQPMETDNRQATEMLHNRAHPPATRNVLPENARLPSYEAMSGQTAGTVFEMMENEVGFRETLDDKFRLATVEAFVPNMPPDILMQHYPTGTYDTMSLAAVHQFGDGNEMEPTRQSLRLPMLGREEIMERIVQNSNMSREELTELTSRPASIGEVMEMLYGFYKGVTRAELQQLAMQFDITANMLAKDIYQIRNEMRDLSQEVRLEQTEQSRLTIVTGGYPPNMPPEERAWFLFEQIRGIDKLKQRWWDQRRGNMWENKALVNQLFQCYPVTIWFNNRWSPLTILRIKEFEYRQMITEHFRDYNPKFVDSTGKVYHKNYIRFTPSSPLFQRKKECLLRAMMSAINQHEDYENYDLTPLWHTLVLMEPQYERAYDPNLPAWAKLEFINTQGGAVECHVTITETCRDVLNTIPDGETETLFSKAYKDQVFGRQRDEDVSERAAADESAEAGWKNTTQSMFNKTDDTEAGVQAQHEAEASLQDPALDEQGSKRQAQVGPDGKPQPPPPPPGAKGNWTSVQIRETQGGAPTRPDRARHWCNAMTSRWALQSPFPFAIRYLIVPDGELKYDKQEYELKMNQRKKQNNTQRVTQVDIAIAGSLAAFTGLDIQDLDQCFATLEDHRQDMVDRIDNMKSLSEQPAIAEQLRLLVEKEEKFVASLHALAEGKDEGSTAKRVLAQAKLLKPASSYAERLRRQAEAVPNTHSGASASGYNEYTEAQQAEANKQTAIGGTTAKGNSKGKQVFPFPPPPPLPYPEAAVNSLASFAAMHQVGGFKQAIPKDTLEMLGTGIPQAIRVVSDWAMTYPDHQHAQSMTQTALSAQHAYSSLFSPTVPPQAAPQGITHRGHVEQPVPTWRQAVASVSPTRNNASTAHIQSQVQMQMQAQAGSAPPPQDQAVQHELQQQGQLQNLTAQLQMMIGTNMQEGQGTYAPMTLPGLTPPAGDTIFPGAVPKSGQYGGFRNPGSPVRAEAAPYPSGAHGSM